MDRELSKADQIKALREARYERWTGTKTVTPAVDNVTKSVTVPKPVTESVTPEYQPSRDALLHENELLRARVALLEAEVERLRPMTPAERKRKSREKKKDERSGGTD